VASEDGVGEAGGLGVDVAAAAQAQAATVELVGKVGDDGAGDGVVVALGRLGVGHAALLRDPARPTPVLAWLPVTSEAETAAAEESSDDLQPTLLPAEPAERPVLEGADVELALRYVTGASVVVVAAPLAEAALAAAVEGAAFCGARLVVLLSPGAAAAALPPDATVLEMPACDDGSFGRLVGTLAAGLDRGVDPGLAFGQAVEATGWEAVQE
jgi:hypothetical protein